MINKGKAILYIGGKKLGTITGTNEAISMEREPLKPATFSFEATLGEDARRAFDKLHEEIAKQRARSVQETNAWLEDCLRTRVVPPIKGEITKGKIRNRGLALCFGPEGEFIGVLQHRSTLYHVDGRTYNTPTQIKRRMNEARRVTDPAGLRILVPASVPGTGAEPDSNS